MIVLLLLVFNSLAIIKSSDHDIGRTIPKFIESRGFGYEIHKIVTEDKYVLTAHRIINPYIPRANLRPVFLQHGIIASGANYLVNAEGFINSSGIYTENGGTIVNRCDIFDTNLDQTIGRTLAFVLSACGYDVWIGNTRGTSYSNKHLEISTNCEFECYAREFWKFSFQQMAFYDIPAYLSYILPKTNTKSLAYIAHSQGTTQMFALLSAKPEYAKKINLFVAMAPVVYFNKLSANIFIKIGAGILSGVLRNDPKCLGTAPYQFGDTPLNILCSVRANGGIYVSLKPSNINESRAGVYDSVLDTTSTWSLAHFAQIVYSGDFVYFDYGSDEKNFQHYNTKQKPIFNIGAITSDRIALIYGDNDNIADIDDVRLLIQRLKVTLLDNYLVNFKGWTHNDFLVSKYTGSLINPKILGLLDQTSDN